ncbi:MAG: hypothetical protein JW846_06850 [Dehalococcoidia bacterium]|nr:hypothetical protein [Dehalococcoidia bacterium]
MDEVPLCSRADWMTTSVSGDTTLCSSQRYVRDMSLHYKYLVTTRTLGQA